MARLARQRHYRTLARRRALWLKDLKMPDQSPVETDKTPPEVPETPENPEKPPLSGPEIQKEITAPIVYAAAKIEEIADEIEEPKWLTPLMTEIKSLSTGLEKLTEKIESLPTPTPTATPTATPEMTPPSELDLDATPKTAPAQNAQKSEKQKSTQEKASRKFW